MKISIKQFFLFTFLFLEMVSMAVFAVENTPRIPVMESSTFVNKRITLTITIVIARNRDCEGFGFCRWGLNADRSALNSGIASVYQDDYIKNSLTLEINKASGISADVYKKYFSTGTFLLEDDFPIPDDVARGLGLTGTKIIAAGKYKMTERNGIIYLSVPFK